MKKRGQVSIQFHWIFIIIAGALILLFFINIAWKQKDISDRKIAGTVISHINSLITSTSTDEEITNAIKTPEIELEFTCNKQGISEYAVKDTGQHIDTPIEIIFSPDIVKGKKLIIWSLPWQMPFKVDNFIVITSTDIRYIIIGSDHSTTVDDLYLNLPYEHLNLEKTSSLSQSQDKNNYKIRLIFIDQEPTTQELPKFIQKMKDTAVSAVKISANQIQFYKKQKDSLISDGEISIIDTFSGKNPLLYAAIFAENSEMYNCALNKAINRLNIIADIYKQRTKKLASSTGACNLYYDTSQLNILSTSKDINEIYSQASLLVSRNKIIQTRDCPLIY